MGEGAVLETKRNLDYPSLEPFYLSDDAVSHMRKAVERGQQWQREWNELFTRYQKEHPDLAGEFQSTVIEQRLPESWGCNLPEFSAEEPMATRSASNQVINALAQNVPTLLGGSADLATSSNTLMKEKGDFSADERMGRNIWFGVRTRYGNHRQWHGSIWRRVPVYWHFFNLLRLHTFSPPHWRFDGRASSACFYP